jgi:hypothetical protein
MKSDSVPQWPEQPFRTDIRPHRAETRWGLFYLYNAMSDKTTKDADNRYSHDMSELVAKFTEMEVQGLAIHQPLQQRPAQGNHESTVKGR